jgi:adenylate cyclase
MLLGRFRLATAADEVRAFVEGSDSAGRGLVPLTAALRASIAATGGKDAGKRGKEPLNVEAQVAAAIKAADPKYVRFGPPRFRVLKRRLRHADFRGRADSSTLTSLSIKARGRDPLAAIATLMHLEGLGLVAIGPDPYRKKGAMIVVSGAEAVRKVRSAKVLSSKRRQSLRPIRRRATISPGDVRARVRYPIALKLLLITTPLVAAALAAMIFLTSYLFREEGRVRIEENDQQTNQVLSLKVGDDFLGIVAKTRLLLSLRNVAGLSGAVVVAAPDDVSASTPGDTAEGQRILKEFFAANPEILYAGVDSIFEFVNRSKLDEWGADNLVFDRIRETEARALDAGKKAPVVTNVTPAFGRPAALIAVPYNEGEVASSLAIVVDTAAQIEALRALSNGHSFVVNGEGELILHPDAAELSSKKNLGTLPGYEGSFKKINFALLAVASVTPESLAFEAADRVQLLSFYLMAAVLLLVMFFIVIYSKSITGSIGVLMDAVRRLENGDFQLDMEPRTRDELGALTTRIVELGKGLGERDKIKDAFGKFVNKEVAERALHSELSLGGVKRIAAILFTGIRGFPALSESLEPGEVVESLNEYFASVIGCVEKTGGVVDKLIGDAVMAVWGVPTSSGRDSAAAVDAALLTRSALEVLNKARGTPHKPRIRVGCAINSGPVLAGQMGSSRHREYTVLGDAVNFASRLVALTKPFGVDILVSESVRAELGSAYHLEAMPRVIVRGKAGPQHVYAVLGKVADRSAPRSVAELRRRLGIEERRIDMNSPGAGQKKKGTGGAGPVSK